VEALLKAIAEPRRQQILRLVWDREWTAGEVAARFDVSRPDISKHLRILREAGLIAERRVGTRRLYRARPERLAEVRQFLEDAVAHCSRLKDLLRLRGVEIAALVRLAQVRQTRGTSAASPSAARRLNGRAARVGLFLFLVIRMNARGQREKNEQTDDLFHMILQTP